MRLKTMASIDLTLSDDDESPQISCDRCTLLNPADAQRCGACNSPLATQDGPPPPELSTQKKRPRDPGGTAGADIVGAGVVERRHSASASRACACA